MQPIKGRKFVRALASSLALACAGTSFAADHREAPLIQEDLTADIADIYAFLNPIDPDRLVLAMTVNPFSAPSENITYNFSENVRYSFRIDNDGDAIEDVTILFRFVTTPNGQRYRVLMPGQWNFGGAVTSPTEEPEPEEEIIAIDEENDVKIFAGQRDDPFFFDVVGFNRFLAGTGGFEGNDGFAGVNVSAIVIEFPLELVMGSAETLQIWATTERQRTTVVLSSEGQLESGAGPWEQIERMGNPAVNTALIPGDLKNFYNIGHPADDARDFAPSVVASLLSLGTTIENIEILASVAVPDTIKLNPELPVGFPNGRAPADDVVDTLLFFIFNQTPVPDGVDGNDKPFLDAFPFLASPHQPE